MKYRVYYNSKSAQLVADIIKSEDLSVTQRVFVDALGDTLIKVSGSNEEVGIFREIYELAGGDLDG